MLFDSSFLMAVAGQPTTWFEDITQLAGKVQPVTLQCTVEELKRIAAGQLKRSRTAALALELAKDFAVEPSGSGKADDEIVSYALSKHPMVATVDRDLIETLKARKVGVVGLRSGRVALL